MPAPMPDYSNVEYYQVGQPTEKEIGDFPILVDFAGWNVIDDSGNSDLKSWVTSMQETISNNESLTGFTDFMPIGWALVGTLQLNAEPSVGDYFVSGLDDPNNQGSFSAYFGVTVDCNEFKTYIGLDTPTSNGV